MFGENRKEDLQLMQQYIDKYSKKNVNGSYVGMINEAEYDKFIQLLFDFENKKGRYNKYVKRVPRKVLDYWYNNLFNSSQLDILLICSSAIKDEDKKDFLFYVRNKNIYHGNLMFFSIDNPLLFVISHKYWILFQQIYYNYMNDIIKSPEQRCYKIMYVYRKIRLFISSIIIPIKKLFKKKKKEPLKRVIHPPKQKK